MSVGKKPNLPISKTWVQTGKDGNTYIVDVSITQTSDSKKYPSDGIKAVFKVFALDDKGNRVVLVDNHKPHGFHHHPNLPSQEPRKPICAKDYQEAWAIFQKMLKESLK